MNGIRRLRLWAIGLCLLCAAPVYPTDVAAQQQCVTFAEARRLGLFTRFQLRPAGVVKSEVERRTGGQVVGFMICRPGPVYELTVLQRNGNVTTVTVPAR